VVDGYVAMLSLIAMCVYFWALCYAMYCAYVSPIYLSPCTSSQY
jgi:hypothetical protein